MTMSHGCELFERRPCDRLSTGFGTPWPPLLLDTCTARTIRFLSATLELYWTQG